MLSKNQYLEALGADTAELINLAESNPEAPVVHCGDWTTSDLVAHIGAVWNFLGHHVASRATGPDGNMRPSELTGDELFTWAKSIAGSLLEALEGVEPDEVVWSWTSDKTGRFYLRRAAQETAVHLWDMRAATTGVADLEADIACDGIDELFEVTYANLIFDRGIEAPTGSLHLHRTDGEGEWTFDYSDGELITNRAHGKADAAIKGSANDLNLVLWQRLSLDSSDLQFFGDESVAASWTALTR